VSLGVREEKMLNTTGLDKLSSFAMPKCHISNTRFAWLEFCATAKYFSWFLPEISCSHFIYRGRYLLVLSIRSHYFVISFCIKQLLECCRVWPKAVSWLLVYTFCTIFNQIVTLPVAMLLAGDFQKFSPATGDIGILQIIWYCIKI